MAERSTGGGKEELGADLEVFLVAIRQQEIGFIQNHRLRWKRRQKQGKDAMCAIRVALALCNSGGVGSMMCGVSVWGRRPPPGTIPEEGDWKLGRRPLRGAVGTERLPRLQQ